MAVSLLLAALAALALVGINEAGYRQSSRALADIDEAQQIRGTLNQILQNMLDAETGQRGFLLTGEAAYRQPYDIAVKQVDGNLATLRQLYAERPAERTQLSELSKHVLRKIAEMDMSVRLRHEGNEDAWKFVMTTDVGREEMEAIRATANELVKTSNATLQAGQLQVMKSLQLARVGTGIVALAALIAFFLYLRQTHALRSVGERQQEALQRERNALEDEVRERTASLAELATHLQDVRETERGYLARELHDELGSLLTAAKLDVARLKSRLADSPDAIQRLQHLTELLNSGIALKRRIIEDLRPSSLSNLGLVASLEILGREFGERSGLEIEMALEPVTMDESRQLTIYRMVQESLTNIGKYAEASEATIVLKNYANHVIVEVADNGKGFDAQRMRPSTHGLAGMRHRVEAARGKLTITSAPGQGTRLTAMLPVVKPAPQAGTTASPDTPAPRSA
ncbi:CHASE3 domain-containing protein [Variovorax boronicumulans]|uniref:CHASE3 domain-containing protein n=1 Tax=Variovorax boronicumulans TaxID=436515 RepID=UPI000BB3BC96|nr:CHASE3 domain-containing protein [Variovorax boronicumulans]